MKQQAALCIQHQHLSSLQLNSIHISGDLYQTVGRQVISYCCLAELSSGKQPILAQINGSQGSNSYDRVLEWSFFDLKICSKPVTLHELDFQRKEEKKNHYTFSCGNSTIYNNKIEKVKENSAHYFIISHVQKITLSGVCMLKD